MTCPLPAKVPADGPAPAARREVTVGFRHGGHSCFSFVKSEIGAGSRSVGVRLVGSRISSGVGRSGEDAGGREATGRAPGSAGPEEEAGLRANSPEAEAEAAGTGTHPGGWGLQAQRKVRLSLR